MMTENQILQALRDNPSKNINQVANKLKIPSIDVSMAQLNWTRKHLTRNSKGWGIDNESVIKK